MKIEPGIKVGRLTVISRTNNKHQYGDRMWLCRCECGVEKEIRAIALRNVSGSGTRSCGCLKRESLKIPRAKTHGMSTTPEYWALHGAIDRCHNPSTPEYRHYGGRGILVAEEWRGKRGFEKFIEYIDRSIGRRPPVPEGKSRSVYSLDRINVDGNYEPSNIRWATQSEQMKNRRKMVAIQNVPDESLLSELSRRGYRALKLESLRANQGLRA